MFEVTYKRVNCSCLFPYYLYYWFCFNSPSLQLKLKLVSHFSATVSLLLFGFERLLLVSYCHYSFSQYPRFRRGVSSDGD